MTENVGKDKPFTAGPRNTNHRVFQAPFMGLLAERLKPSQREAL
jgi:hypothetical protein